MAIIPNKGTISAMDAMLVLQHLRALHPERAEQLAAVCEFIRKQDSHNVALRRDLLDLATKNDTLKIAYHKSLCQRLKRFFGAAKVNPNVG